MNMHTTHRSITSTRLMFSVLLLSMLALIVSNCGNAGGKDQARTASPAETVITSEPATLPPAYPNTLRIWRDSSGSMDDGTLAKIADDLLAEIARHKEKIVGIEVVRFAEEGKSMWQAIPQRFVWGSPPDIKAFRVDTENAPTDAKMFKGANDDYRHEQERRYNEEKTRILGEYKARVEEQLRKVKDYLLESSTVKAPCTQFVSLAARIKKEDLPYNLTITDGWADCPDEHNKAIEGAHVRGKHVIIQLGRHTDSQASDGDISTRESFLHALFPSADIFPPYTLGKAVDSLLP